MAKIKKNQYELPTPADVGAVPTSRTVSAGTGLSGGGALTANVSLAVVYGTAAGTAAQGDDARLSNARTPTAHAASHAPGQPDSLSGSYELAGAAAAARTAHEGAPDPHTQYLTTGRGDARYQLLDADLTTIAGLTATTDNVIQSVGGAWASRTPAQVKATLALAKGDVGLGNVDNTSDANKPVSSAQQTAINGRQPLDDQLTALAALAGGSDQLPYFTSATAAAQTTITSFIRTVLDDADAATARGTLGAVSTADSRLSDARTPTAHVHSGADLTSGTVPFARLPVGNTSVTVAQGDHTHAGSGGGGFAAGLVPATSTTPTVTHGLGTRDLIVSVREVATDLIVRVVPETISDNEIRFTFTTQPTAGQYRYTILSAAATLGTGAHSHAQAEISGLISSLGNKSDVGHSHVQADITGLIASLGGKSDVGHAHSALDITSGTLDLARIPTGTGAAQVALGNHGHSGFLTGVVPYPVVNLTDAATIATNAAQGVHFRCTLTADRALGIPTNPTDGQKGLWEFTAGAAQRVVTIPSGSADSFEPSVAAPGSSITIPANKVGFLGAIYSQARQRWTQLAVTTT